MECYHKADTGADDNVVILSVRGALLQGFEADDWTDLRIGWFLSITDASNDNLITSIDEDIGATDRTPLLWTDRVAIGVTDRATGSTFCGYTNAPTGRISPGFGKSRLLSSDIGVGTSDTDYWRATNGRGNKYTAQIAESGITRAASTTGSQPHVVQNYAGGHAAGYASLWGIRLTRPDARTRSKIITMQIPKAASGDSSDILFSSAPTKALVESELESFPTSVQTLGPVELSHAPDAFYLYWPFHDSRLRIHADGIVKVLG